MAPDVTIVIADPARLPAIREGAALPGRVMHFTSTSLGSAFESIRAYRPKVVAVDAIFAQTPSGASFVDKVEAMGVSGRSTLLIVEEDGRWITMPRNLAKVLNPPQPAASAPAPLLAVASGVEPINTRRAPRFVVRAPIDVSVEDGSASLVDMSVLGAQLVSVPVLRPGQRLSVGLPDSTDILNVTAQVAWSMYERPRAQEEPHYRVGLEFTGPAQHALEDFRQRHCADQPTTSRR